MPTKSPFSDPRVPPPYEGIQINFCKNMECSHFGSPASTEKQPRGPGANERPNDGYILGSKDGFRTLLICKSCRQYSTLKSNKAIQKEYTRFAAYLDDPPPLKSCPNKECLNHAVDVSIGSSPYQWFGVTSTDSRRYRCKACGRTFSFSKRAKARQRLAHKNRTFFKLLVNKEPLKRICEVLDIGMPTVYRKIDFLHAQCLAFAASRERQLATLALHRLYISTDARNTPLTGSTPATSATLS